MKQRYNSILEKCETISALVRLYEKVCFQAIESSDVLTSDEQSMAVSCYYHIEELLEDLCGEVYLNNKPKD